MTDTQPRVHRDTGDPAPAEREVPSGTPALPPLELAIAAQVRALRRATGLSVADSEALLDALWAHATKDEFTWYQQWRAGDLILWDNRCVMHRRDAFDPATRRVMHRTQIKGDRPF